MRHLPFLAPVLLVPALALAGEPVVDIPWIAASPVVDGTIAAGEYAGAFSLALDGLTPNDNPGWNPYNSNTIATADLTFTFYLAHDGTALYVAFDIADTPSSARFPGPNQANVSVWEDDCTEVFIDGDFDRDQPSEGSGPGQGTGDRSWAEGMIPHYGIPTGVYWDNNFNLYGPASGWYARSAIVNAGRWQSEYRIPFTAIDTQNGTGTRALAVGDTFGLNVLANDADSGQGRKHQLAWNGVTHNDQLYQQQQAWVPVRLAPQPTATPTPTPHAEAWLVE